MSASIHKEPVRERRRILQAASELVDAQSFVGVPPQQDEEVVFQGEPLLTSWDCTQIATILNDPSLFAESGYVIINNVRETSWGVRFSRVLNLLAVPVAARKRPGWILAFNNRVVAGRSPGNPAARRGSTPGPGEPASKPRRSSHSVAGTPHCSCHLPRSWASMLNPITATITSRNFWSA